jgi:hypothetical protein
VKFGGWQRLHAENAKQFGVGTRLEGRHYETCKEGHAEIPQEHCGDRIEAQGIHGRGTSRDERAPPGAEGGDAPALSPKTWYGMPAYAKDGNVVGHSSFSDIAHAAPKTAFSHGLDPHPELLPPLRGVNRRYVVD